MKKLSSSSAPSVLGNEARSCGTLLSPKLESALSIEKMLSGYASRMSLPSLVRGAECGRPQLACLHKRTM